MKIRVFNETDPYPEEPTHQKITIRHFKNTHPLLSTYTANWTIFHRRLADVRRVTEQSIVVAIRLHENPLRKICRDIFFRFDTVPILYGLYIPPFLIPGPRLWPARGCNSGDSILGAEEISFIVKCFSSSRTLTISNAVANGKLKTRSERPGPRVCCINILYGGVFSMKRRYL